MKENYIKNILIILLILIVVSLFIVNITSVRAEDNKTTQWNTQLVYDNVNACYQGTYRWILMANPALIGKSPPIIVQRQMVQHCFCVLDKIRVEFPTEKYIELIGMGVSVGELYMKKAYECIEEYDTMRGIIILQDSLDNATKSDNGTIEKLEVLPAEPEGPEESSPDEKPKDQQTILQG
jgi:hypothetical protein